MKNDVELTDGTITIRPLRPSDIDDLYGAISESIGELSQWLSWFRPDYSIEDAREWLGSREEAWAEGTNYDFAITRAKNGLLLGWIALDQIHRRHMFANLGYWVRTSQLGQGIATAATLLVAKFGVVNVGLHRIEIVIAADNETSQRVAEKVGATREGILRERLDIHGQIHDAVMYSLIAADLK